MKYQIDSTALLTSDLANLSIAELEHRYNLEEQLGIDSTKTFRALSKAPYHYFIEWGEKAQVYGEGFEYQIKMYTKEAAIALYDKLSANENFIVKMTEFDDSNIGNFDDEDF